MGRYTAHAQVVRRSLNVNFALHLTICMTMLVSATFYNTQLHRAFVEWQLLFLMGFSTVLFIGVASFYLANTVDPGYVLCEDDDTRKEIHRQGTCTTPV